MREWWSTLFGHPPVCWSCSIPIPSFRCKRGWDQLCTTCRKQIKPIGLPGCVVCGRVEKCGDSEICFDCARVPSKDWVYNRSAVDYTEQIKQIVHIFKYKGNIKLVEPIGSWMSEVFVREFIDKEISMITFVPLTEDRLRERGFNQAERLALQVGKCVKLPVLYLLKRSYAHSSQSKRGRRERLLSLRGAFHLPTEIAPNLIQNKGILIIDDVYTTGTTLRACARPLLECGASRIYALTFAR